MPQILEQPPKNMKKSKILIIGSTGYIGRHITNASLQLGYPTYVLARPDYVKDVNKVAMVIGFKDAGATIFEGSLDDHESLIHALKKVDIVICSIAEKKLDDQLKLIDAIKQVGNIKRFLPSEFGMDPVVMEHAIAPGNEVFIAKRKIRKAIEAAGIPHTYVSANCFAGFFLGAIGQVDSFIPPRESINIYGSGDAKVIWVNEDDVGTYVVKSADDPRTLNKSVFIRPPENILSQKEVLGIWESLSGKKLKRHFMTEQDIFDQIADEGNSHFMKTVWAHFYQIFYRGDLVFDLGPEHCDTHALFPEVQYRTVESYMRRFL